MFNVKTKPALDLLAGVCKRRRLGLTEIVDAAEGTTVREVLRTKYPPAAPIHHECLIADSPAYHPEALDGSVIHAAGPSGVDAYGWPRLCSSFKSASDELCCSIAVLARRLCTSFVDPSIVAPLLACFG